MLYIREQYYTRNSVLLLKAPSFAVTIILMFRLHENNKNSHEYDKSLYLPTKLSSLSWLMGLLLKVRYLREPPTRLRLSGTVTNPLSDKSICCSFVNPLNASRGMLLMSVLAKSNT